jgi:cell division protein FtsX
MIKELMISIGLQVIHTLLTVGILGFLGARGISLFEKITKTKLTAEQRAEVDAVLKKAIGWVDEQAHKLAKGLITQGPGTPLEKLMEAEKMARSLAPELLKAIPSSELRALIEAALPEHRATTATPTEPREITIANPAVRFP